MREAKKLGCQTPMIFLTGMGRHEIDLEAMGAGAVDYLAKGKVDPESLERSIRYAVERKTLEAMFVQSEKLSAMGQLAAGLAHELNNPLMLIIGTVKTLLEAEPVDPHLAEALKRIDRSSERCRELVRELLAFSRKDESPSHEFDLTEAVVAALSLVKTQAKIQGVAIENEAPHIPLKILGHKSHIEQVVINLCNNALDAMPTGGRLSIHLGRTHRKQRDFAQVKVSDTGPGIPAKLMGRIFEPFFTTKPADKGTGLGLSIIQKLVHQHGGEVEVASVEKRGTSFTVTLPLAETKRSRSTRHATQDPGR
jgi:two-component system NtrC family sensor kinase